MRAKKNQYATPYVVTRAYGGPEEGGWWYSMYIRVGKAKICRTHKVRKVAERMLAELEECDPYGIRRYDHYTVMVERFPGEFETKNRPTYE